MKLIDGLEYFFYIALIALLIYGPPPVSEENDALANDSMIAVTQSATVQLNSW